MVRETNERLTITLTKKQIEWLKRTAKKLKISVSELVSFLINKNVSLMIRNFTTDEELDRLYKIAKTPLWINLDDEDI